MNPAFHLGLSRDTRPWRPDVVTAWRSGSTEPATLATRAWGAVPIVLALAVYRRAVTTGFAQDDFHWLIAATTFDSTPAYAPRFLSMHLAFRAIVHLCGTNALAFHVVALVLLAASAWLIYAVLARRLPPAAAALGTSLCVTSPVIFNAVHWTSAIADLFCLFFLALAAGAFTAPRRVASMRWVALIAYVLAIASKEVALGASPLLAALDWREGTPGGRVRAALYLLAGGLSAMVALSPWGRVAGGEAYACSVAAVPGNAAGYLAAVFAGGTAARSPSDQDWARHALALAGGAAILAGWVAALAWRRRSEATLAALAFALLLVPVLPLEHQFYFYYATVALPAFWASLMLLAIPRAATRPPAWIMAVAALVCAAQVTAVEIRAGAQLVNVRLPLDFVLRRAEIARNALDDLVAQRDRLGSEVVFIGQQPVESATGGALTTPETGYLRDPFLDANVRSALAEGDALRLVRPGVRSSEFVSWVNESDTARTIIAYEIDGHLRVMEYDTYAGVSPLDPADPCRLRMERAARFIERRMFIDAIRELYEAARCSPADPAPWVNLGAAAWAIGDTATAERSLARALALAPDDREARFNLGVLQWGRGLAEAARCTWAPLLAEVPPSGLAQRVRRLLAAAAR